MSSLAEPFLHNGYSYPAYHVPHTDVLCRLANAFEERFISSCKVRGWNLTTFYIDHNCLFEALTRTDQRKLHYLMYHGFKMNELKETAVFCYWLIRFKVIQRQQGGPTNINEQIALEFMLDAVAKHKDGKGEHFAGLSSRLENDFLYALTYRLGSYDELSLYLELLSE